MVLSLEDVRHIAHLARIELTAAEAIDLQRKLAGIFDMVGEMRAVDTTGIVPMSHAQDVMLRLREDVVTESDMHAAYQQCAPAVEHDLYMVPRVIE